jgi:hypothetical protein
VIREKKVAPKGAWREFDTYAIISDPFWLTAPHAPLHAFKHGAGTTVEQLVNPHADYAFFAMQHNLTNFFSRALTFDASVS